MPSSIPLNPNAFATEAQAEAFIGRGNSFDSAGSDAVVAGINWATREMERMTGRQLKVRTHSLQQSASVVYDPGGSRILPNGSPAAIVLASARIGDPVVCAGSAFPLYARVTGPYDGTGLPVAGASAILAGTGTATIGDGGLTFDGDGSRFLCVYDTPLKAVYSASFVNGLGGYSAINLTNAIYDYGIGKVQLLNDIFYRGASNIVLECRCGYEQPSGSALGDPGDWEALQLITLRLAQLYWQEWMTPTGRNSSASAGQAHANTITQALPADLLAMIMGYAVIG